MKSFLKKTAYLIISIVGVVILMASFRICPPSGPWPTPPWCVEFERKHFDLNIAVSPLKVTPSVNMADTWGRNYNFSMFESTRENIESSFSVVQDLGAREVYVHDFHRAIYRDDEQELGSINYDIVDETFWNDFRDESFSENDLANLTKAAHDRGLKVGVRHNMSFVNIGKYLAKGVTGQISESVEADFKILAEVSKNEVWIEAFFEKWEVRLVERAKLYQKYGVDMMDITPGWMNPSFSGNEKLADELWKQLIASVREEFSGKIIADANFYGLLDGRAGEEDYRAYTYLSDVDIVLVPFYGLHGEYRTGGGVSVSTVEQSLDRVLGKLSREADRRGVKLSLFYSPFSYRGAINELPVEALDIRNPNIQALVASEEEQRDAYQAMFQSIAKFPQFERIIAGNMWWDDARDPLVSVPISILPTFRNKPAEAVISAWFRAMPQE